MSPAPHTTSAATASGLVQGSASLAGFVVRAVRVLLGLLLLAMVLLNVANALARYLLGQAIGGSDELLVFGMVWLVFLGCAFVTADRRQLSFDVLQQRLPDRARALVRLAGDLVAAGLLGFVALQSLQVVERLWTLNQWSMAAAVPTYVPHSAILIGFGLTLLVLLAAIVKGTATALRLSSRDSSVGTSGGQDA
ncbi:MAG: TRAP transporter small permease [Kiloniellales bacterium]